MADKVSTKNSWWPAYKTPILVIGALIVLFLVFMSGAAAGKFSNGLYNQHFNHFADRGLMPRMHHSFGLDNGLNNAQNRVRGTVTNVSGDTFTVAGYGATTQIKTTTSTQYQGGNQVKVNDTVVILGSTTNGTLTATQVSINP
jgi:hypothetical protein